jgi:hypothetical protein
VDDDGELFIYFGEKGAIFWGTNMQQSISYISERINHHPLLAPCSRKR